MAEYIDREALKNDIAKSTEPFNTGSVFRAINCQIAADVAPVVHGVWIPVHESEISGWNPEVAGIDPIDGYICSACKNEAVYDCNDKFVLSDYCPWCGARMDGDSNDKAD